MLKGDSGPSGWDWAVISLRACWLLDSVGLVEDHCGSDLHDHGIGASLDRVVAQLLHFAVDQNFYDAALN